ncbi:MAG TPA: GNAT family N-acetyltransferase [Acidobacteriota bacterium]|nr:GNAT family N-acetyltransferase [Acidobacteriota bacterium]
MKKLTVHPVTPDRWQDFETLFGSNGGCGGCWCIWWRRTRSEFERKKGAGNKRAMKKIIASGGVPGLIAYAGDEPVGWCAVAPREDYPGLERSRILAPVDDQSVWSITCFFIARGWRRRGVSAALIQAAAKHAQKHGAKIIEGYPHIPKKDRATDAFIWTGVASAFAAAGFVEVARRSSHRPIMRRSLQAKRK